MRGGALKTYGDVWDDSIFRTASTVLRNSLLLTRSSGLTNFEPSSQLVRTFGFSDEGVDSSSVLFLVSTILNLPPPSLLPKAYHLSSRTATRSRSFRPFPYFRGILRSSVPRSILSKYGASGKVLVVQSGNGTRW